MKGHLGLLWSVTWNPPVYGYSIIVKSLPALDPHSLIASLCQKMAVTELIDLIYTIRKVSSEHYNDSTPEPSNLQMW